MLLGIPGDNTYSNYQEATRTFWRSTVLPLVTRTAKALSTWLSPAYGGVRPSGSDTMAPPLELRPDLDAIEALNPEREALWTRIDKATFLTADEKRAAVGYGPYRGGRATISRTSTVPTKRATSSAVGPMRVAAGRPRTPSAGHSLHKAAGVLDDKRGPRLNRPAMTPPRPALGTRPAACASWSRHGKGHRALSETIEGRITHQEATAEAAEARLAEILRDAIPNANPSWGANRLTKELYERGFVLERPTEFAGASVYKNRDTGEEVRIMERPPRQRRSDPQEKHPFEHYYRYRSGPGKREGAHVPIPDKD